MGCGRYRFDLERRGDDPPGTYFAFVKMRGRAPLACVFPDFDNPRETCGRMADNLCDEPLRHERGTCSAPMCARHSTQIGPDRHVCPRHTLERLPLFALEDATT